MKLPRIKFKSFTVQLNKIIVMTTLYTFLLSLLPLNAEDKGGLPALFISLQKTVTRVNVAGAYQCSNDLMPIVLTCRFTGKDTLRLAWNSEKADTLFFILKKTDEKIGWQLMSERTGLKKNTWSGKILPHEAAGYVVVRATPELLSLITGSGIDNWRLFYATVNELVKDRMIQYVSNEINVNPEGTQKSSPGRPIWQDYQTAADGSGTYLAWRDPVSDDTGQKTAEARKYIVYKKQSGANTYYFTADCKLNDPENTGKTNARYYVWALDQTGNTGLPLIYSKDKSGNDPAYPMASYALDHRQAQRITNGSLKLELPAEAVTPDSVLTVTQLNEAYLYTPPAASVTRGAEGYDLSINGDSANQLLKEIKVTIAYDPAKLPKGEEEKNICIYRYNDAYRQWEALPRAAIDTKNKTVTSTVTHLCQFFAGTVTVQGEPPQSKGLNTNPANIQPVDPLAGITQVAPPVPNNRGTADLSFPLNLPPGINQSTTPQVTINYNSDDNLGDCGLGWSLNTRKIEIKTNNVGVPKYDGNDPLLLNGNELVPTGNNTYRQKNDASFSLIEKSGSGFVEKQTDGTWLYYGTQAPAQAFNPDKPAEIFKWYLERIVDKFQNAIYYVYEKNGNDCWPVKILYGYYRNPDGYFYSNDYMYSLQLVWADKTDLRTSYRSGFLLTAGRKLSYADIRVHNPIGNSGTVIKRYCLDYIPGAFEKTLLAGVREMENDTANATMLNETKFEYDKTIDPLKVLGGYSSCSDKIQLIDFNGDGAQEIYDNYKLIYNLNKNISIGMPYLFTGYTSVATSPHQIIPGSVLFDYNNDGLQDQLIDSYNVEWCWEHNTYERRSLIGTYCNFNKTGKQFENSNLKINLPSPIFQGSDHEFPGDFNGDGKPDHFYKFIKSDYTQCLAYDTWNGSAFANYNYCTLNNEINLYNVITKNTIDINGDGLIDLLPYFTFSDGNRLKYPVINGGKNNFSVISNAWNLDLYDNTDQIAYYRVTNASFVDFNNDGLVDILTNRVTPGTDPIFASGLYIFFNTGSGFVINSLKLYDAGVLLPISDINGDGYPDLIYGAGYKLNLLTNKNTLTKVTNTITGVKTSLEYSQAYYDPNRSTTYNYRNKRVLSAATTGNELTQIRTEYRYSDGIYDRLEKEFRGFGKVTSRVQDKAIKDKTVVHISETQYLVNQTTGMDQYNINPVYDQYVKGQVLRERTLLETNGTSIVLADKKYVYKTVSLLTNYPAVKFVYPEKVLTGYYNDQGEFIGNSVTQVEDKLNDGILTACLFDNTAGMITQKTETAYGDPHHPQDDTKTVTAFARNIAYSQWISVPSQVQTYDVANNSLLLTKNYYYDYNSAVGTLTNGVLTSEQAISPTAAGRPATTRYTYDTDNESYGNVILIDQPDGTVIHCRTEYQPADAAGSQVKSIKSQSCAPDDTDYLKQTVWTDAYGRVIKMQDVYGDFSSTAYDKWGRLTALTEKAGDSSLTTKKFSYNSGTAAENSLTFKYFTAQGEYLDNTADAADPYLAVQFIRDSLGRNLQTKKETAVDGVRSWLISGKIVRDEMGRAISQGKPFSADYALNSLYISPPVDNYLTEFTYDNLGRFTSMTAPRENGGSYTVTKSYTKGPEVGYDLITESSITRIVSSETIRDSMGKETYETKDLSGAIIRTGEKRDEEHNYATNEFGYNLSGYAKVREFTEPINLIGEKQFNALGQLNWMRSPDAGKLEYLYNLKQQVTEIRDYGRNEADYRTINLSYDGKGRMTAIDYPGYLDDITYTYYGTDSSVSQYNRGNIQTITKGSYYTAEYSYTQFGVTEHKTIDGTMNYTTNYQYDVQGRISNVAYPDGEMVRYSYDKGGMLYSITGNQPYLEYIKYNTFGQRAEVKYHNGNVIKYDYEPSTNMLKTMTDLDKNNTELLRYNYSYGDDLNLTSLIDAPGGVQKSQQNYTYQLNGALQNFEGILPGTNLYNNSESIVYDEGDRIKSRVLKDSQGHNIYYTYSYAENTHGVTGIAVTGSSEMTGINLIYDDYGNLKKKSIVNGSTVKDTYLTYNACNQVATIAMPGVGSLEFKYDAGGQRIKKVWHEQGGFTFETLYVNGVYSVTNNKSTKFISDGSKIIAEIRENNPDTVLYYTHGNLGSTSLLTDNEGKRKSAYLYTPLGKVWAAEDTDGNFAGDNALVTHKFAGYETDAESGFSYLTNRYYDPMIGQFLNPDPLRAGLNHYGYAGSNPITYSDPTGLLDHTPTTQSDFDALKKEAEDAKQKSSSSSSSSTQDQNNSNNHSNKQPTLDDIIKNPNLTFDQKKKAINDYFEKNNNYKAMLDEAEKAAQALRDVGFNVSVICLVAVAAIGCWPTIAAVLEGLGLKAGDVTTKVINPVIENLSKNNLKHLGKHLEEFKALNPDMSLDDVIELGGNIVKPDNLISLANASQKVYESLVMIGGQEVKVRAVLNSIDKLHSVHIRYK